MIRTEYFLSLLFENNCLRILGAQLVDHDLIAITILPTVPILNNTSQRLILTTLKVLQLVISKP